MFLNSAILVLSSMYVMIVKGRICPVCGAPVGKMIDENGEMLGFTCYGKTPHLSEPTKQELEEHEASITRGEHMSAHLKFRNEM